MSEGKQLLQQKAHPLFLIGTDGEHFFQMPRHSIDAYQFFNVCFHQKMLSNQKA